jgi:hypothetical protein
LEGECGLRLATLGGYTNKQERWDLAPWTVGSRQGFDES